MSHALGWVPSTPGLKESLDRAATELMTTDDRMDVTEIGDKLFIILKDSALHWYVTKFHGGRVTKSGEATPYFRGFVEGVLRQTGYKGPVCFTE